MQHAEKPSSLLSDLPRGDPDRVPADLDPDGFKAPGATFMKPSLFTEPEFSWAAGKLFVGVVGGTVKKDGDGNRYVTGGRAVGIDDNRHVCTFAGSRAGKGRAVIIPNMLHYPGAVLATDPKGELATITARRRRDLGQQVYVMDPFGIVEGSAAQYRRGFNPVAAMRADQNASGGAWPDTLQEDAALIADALVQVSDKDPHWDEAARSFIEGVILHVRTRARYRTDGGSLVDVWRMIGRDMRPAAGSEDKAKLHAEMESNPFEAVKIAAAEFFERPDRERESVLSTARRHLKFIGYQAIQNSLLTHELDLADLKHEAMTVYLCLPARHMTTCARWVRLFINLALQAMEREKGRPRLPVLFCLDEFATLGKMQQIEDAAGQIAGFGVRLWPILQDLGQLKALYGERWETFLGNAGIVQFFGNGDLTTLDWVSKRCGRTSLALSSKNEFSLHQSQEGLTGERLQSQTMELLTAEEAARFFGRDDPRLRQLVIWAGRRNPLLVLQRVFYDRHELFRENGMPLFDPTPAELAALLQGDGAGDAG